MTETIRCWFVTVAAVMLCAASCATKPAPSSAPAQQPASAVHITFTAQSDSFATATSEYIALWNREGARIVAAMEQATGIRFDEPPYADTAIAAVVFEGVSNSGYREKPMMLRASYPEPTRRATLVHELGHRLQVGVAGDVDEHEVLFYWIYDVWVNLWGKPFADEQVLVEKARRGPYPRAWDAALALSAGERAAKFRQLLDRKRNR